MTDKPNDNPNPNYGKPARLMKMEKGVPTTPVTVTPLEMPIEGEEHWLDREERKYHELCDKLIFRGFDFRTWREGRINSRHFELDFAVAALALIEKLEARVKELETIAHVHE